MTSAPEPAAARAVGDHEPGSVFAERFAIERVLGEGGSGVVYLARVLATPEPHPTAAPALATDDRVALKILHRHLVNDDQVSRRFVREARILQSLTGPHLARLLAFGEGDGGELYTAMELVEGQSLDVVAGQQPLGPERAADLVSQICAALAVAHAAGIVHRDLKPLNVIVESRGGADHVRVLDFGMAKILRGDLQCSVNNLTQQNMVFGTPAYMAPEQARGDEVDERCDIYAAGVILYELLTGTLPFQAATPIAMMSAHLVDEPEPPSRRAPRAAIPPALEAVVLHALAKRPAHRYPSANSLQEALRAAIEHPTDVVSIIPPASRDELEQRDTDPFLHMTASLRRTEVSIPAPELSASGVTSGLPRGVVLLAVLAALLGIAVGFLMSFAKGGP